MKSYYPSLSIYMYILYTGIPAISEYMDLIQMEANFPWNVILNNYYNPHTCMC